MTSVVETKSPAAEAAPLPLDLEAIELQAQTPGRCLGSDRVGIISAGPGGFRIVACPSCRREWGILHGGMSPAAPTHAPASDVPRLVAEIRRLREMVAHARAEERAYISAAFTARWGADARRVPSMFIQDLPPDPRGA